MADPKNEPGKNPATDKQTGNNTGAGAKVSAGTSVGNIGEAPMPHAQDASKPAQSSTLASHTSKPLGGHGADREGAQNQSGKDQASSSKGQSGSASDASHKAASQAGGGVREATEQARQKAGEAYEDASEWAQDTYERVSNWASDTYEDQHGRVRYVRDRSTKAFGNVRSGLQQYVSENPMVVGLVGLAAGLALGALLPRTRRENEMFGEWADEVRQQGLRYARDAANVGREYVEETFSGDDPRFSRHESELKPDQPGTNRH
jgi:ElaB/YqjD/DUF883 family membrane-anchored ribosome-binding protein